MVTAEKPQTSDRKLIAGGRPDDIFHVPVPLGEFDRADVIASIAGHLIASGNHGLSHLNGVDIGYLWKAKGGKKGGKAVYGKTVKPSGLTAFFGQHEFVVWIAADNTSLASFTCWQMEALVYHELSHIAVQETDDEEAEETLTIVGHDIEEFHDVMRLYGEWEPSISRSREILQARMVLP